MSLVTLIITSIFACNSADQSFSAQNQDIYADGGYADFTLTPEEVVFTEVESGITYSLGFTVESTGDSTLQIDKVDITNSAEGVFYIDTSATEDVNLDPGVAREFIVIAQAAEAGVYIGEARIRSNVASASDLRVPLCTFPVGYEGELTCTAIDEADDTAETVDTGTEDTATE
jgi:hypothetical protein